MNKRKFFIAAAMVVIIVLCIFIAKTIYDVVKPNYPNDLEAYVQEYISQLDPDIAHDEDDPEHIEFKNDMYLLKQVYPDKSYEELQDEMYDRLEDDAEFEKLLHPNGHMNRIEKKIMISAAAIVVILILCIIMVRKTAKAKLD